MRLVNPYQVAFREARSAVKSQHVLQRRPRIRQRWPKPSPIAPWWSAPLREAPRAGASLCAAWNKAASSSPRDWRRPPAPVALLFGSEKFGLSNDDLSHCHWLMRIPTREEHGSMNLGQAVAVCLYEIIRQPPRALAQPPTKPSAKADDLERITLLLEEVLAHSGYVHAATGGSTRLKLRRLVRRLDLDQRDAVALLGMLRQIRWKLLT